MGRSSVAGPHVFEGSFGVCTQGTKAELIAAGAVRGDLWPGDPGAKKTTARTVDAQGRPVRIECYGRQFRAWRKWTPAERVAHEARMREQLDRLARENEARARMSEHLKMAELREAARDMGLSFSEEELRAILAWDPGRAERAARLNPYPRGSDLHARWTSAYLRILREQEEISNPDLARMARVRAAESDTDFQKFMKGLRT